MLLEPITQYRDANSVMKTIILFDGHYKYNVSLKITFAATLLELKTIMAFSIPTWIVLMQKPNK